MVDFLRTPSAQLIIGLASLAILSIIGVYVVRRFRDSIEDEETTSDLLTKFREMHHEGYLDESEYRTIRTDLDNKLSGRQDQRKTQDSGQGKDDRSKLS